MALFTLLSAAAANAAIAVDATSSGSGPGDITVQHTTSGANRLMLVGISAGAGGSSAAISSVKYNNVALTLVGSASTSDNYTKMWMYRLVAPDTGTYDLVVDYSSNPGQGSVVGVMTFTGVDQTTPLGTFQGAANHNTGPATVNVSSATGELVFDTVATCWNALNAVGSGQTQRWKVAPASTEGGGSTEAGDSTVTMSWTLKNSQSWAIGAVPIKPAATTDVDLANHAAGQEADKFTTASSVTGAELFAFKLTNNTAGSKTVDQIVFPLSSVTGIAQGDFANLAIYVDANNDGTIGAGETTSVGGSGVVNAGVSTITFTTDFTIGASSTVNYILKGDVSSLVGTDTVTIGLGTSNITLTSGTVGGSAATNVTHTADNVDLTQIHVRWRNDDGGEGGFNTGTGADGAISLSSNLNLNTQARAGGRSYPDGVAYRVGAISGTSITLRNAAGTTLSNTNGIAAGDEILIINLQGSSSDNGSVGNYEFLKVQSVSGGVLTVASAPGNDYDGSGNSFTTQKVFVQRVPQYTNVTTNAYSITSGAWDGGTDHDDSSCTDNQYTGIVAFRATGTVTVSASGSISANALGYRGGAGGATTPTGGTNGESFDGSVGSGGLYNATGTSGGGSGDQNTGKGTQTSRGGGGGNDCGTSGGTGGSGGNTGVSAGGGGAGYMGCPGSGSISGGNAGSGATTGQGGAGSNASGGYGGSGGGGGGGTYGAAALTTLFPGSGGGGGGGTNGPSGSARAGGAGGGIVLIIANTVTVSGAIRSNGDQGQAASYASGGGGGAGGSVLIQANSATLGSSLVTATGGAVSAPTSAQGAGGGGAGGVGRIRVEADTRSGTTSPTWSEAGTPGGGAGATWAAAEDTKLTGAEFGTLYRLRFMVSNEGTDSSGPVTYKLQMAKTGTCGSGSYSDVPERGTDASAHWQLFPSDYLTDGASTTNVADGLTDENSTFVAGQVKQEANTTGGITLTGTQFTEIEFAIKATISAEAEADYCFRLFNATDSNELDSYDVYGEVRMAAVTAVTLLDLRARGAGEAVTVSWETGVEGENMGFHLYRAESRGGPYVRLTEGLIAGGFDAIGGSYRFTDSGVVRGRIYYYRLEDVDVFGAATIHGPICVDWDADGLPDDWELAHGLDPGANDADLDPDGDGVANWLEYERGTDPSTPDAPRTGPPAGGSRGGSLDAAVQVVSADAGGMTLELLTPGFDATRVAVGGQEFERLRLPAYVHGFTAGEGLPQLPQKGVLLDLPAGRRARLSVLGVESRTHAGYRVYPVPGHRVGENGELAEVFRWEEAAYRSDAFHPQGAAELAGSYLFREKERQRLLFYPLQFNPATGELRHHARIRVRVDFEEPPSPKVSATQAAAGASAGVRLAAPAAEASGEGGWPPPAGAASLKLSTDGEGLYRVSREWLVSQGIGAAAIEAFDLSRVQLFHLGAEQALQVEDLNGNRRLDDGEGLVLYAAPVAAAHAKFARHNAYWLIDAGSAAPLRMGAIEGTPAGGPLALSHQFRLHHELNQTYVQTAPGADGLERWIFSKIAIGSGFSHPLAGQAASYPLSLPGTLGAGELTLRLYSPYDLAHTAAVQVNGVAVGEVSWSGIGYAEHAFPAVALLAGENTVAIRCENPTDKLGVDWFAVTYPREFTAQADSLKFTHAAGQRFRLEGFGEAEVALYDISRPEAVGRVENGVLSGAGPFALEAEPAAGAGERTYLAVARGALRSPAAVVPGRFADLSGGGAGADWILITDRELGWDAGGDPRAWVEELTALRRSQGLRTAVVDVAQIYDEFGYGLPTPPAIKEFLTHAYAHWERPAPLYVLLVGDASYDYKNNWNLSPAAVNRVPAYLIYTLHQGETAADECYVQVSGADALADLYIGRLPAATPEQAAAMAAKIVAYETAANTKSWQRRVLLAADNATEAWEAVFETMNEELAALLPAGMEIPQRFYLGEYENESLAVSDLTSDLIAAMNAGALWVNFSGHGSVNLWAPERILDNRGAPYRADVDGLLNAGRYPFVVNLACLTGYFIYPFAGSGWQSLAEAWLRPAERGAVAALMPSGMTTTDPQQVLARGLSAAVFERDERTLGPAVAAAREALLANGGAEAAETSNTFVLFGDPATRLKLPLPRRPAGVTAGQQAGAVMLAWAAALDCNGQPAAGYNLCRREAGSSERVRLNGVLITDLSAVEDWLAAGLIPGQGYYYAVTAVDADGDESVASAEVGLWLAALDSGGGGNDGGGGGGGSSGGGGGGCFIATSGWGAAADLLRPASVMALLICLVWISRKRK